MTTWQTGVPAAPQPSVADRPLTLAERDSLLMLWREKAASLEALKLAELNLRNLVIKHCFPGTDLDGTQNFELGHGYTLKAIFRRNYKLDKSEDKVDAALTKLEKSGENGKFIADRLVKWKPEVSISEYKELSDIHKRIIGEVLTITPGQPQLEIVEPKGSK